MADPNQLARIAVKPRAIQAFVVPPIPPMPERFVRQFDLGAWQSEMDLWRQNLQTAIQDALTSIKSQS